MDPLVGEIRIKVQELCRFECGELLETFSLFITLDVWCGPETDEIAVHVLDLRKGVTRESQVQIVSVMEV